MDLPPLRLPRLGLRKVMMNKRLYVEGVGKRFGSFSAIEGLDFSVDPGRVVGLVGPNGCGKTTTLRCVVGLLEPNAGRIEIDGEPVASRRAKAGLAYVPDYPAGLAELTVREFLALVRTLYKAPASFDARARALLNAFSLESRHNTMLVALSLGMRRIVSFVAALALLPPLLVADEATAALDPEAVVVVREALLAVASNGTGVLLATQDLHFAERTCDEVILLSAGRTIAAGSIEELFARYGAASLEQVFLTALGKGAGIDLEQVFGAH